jgi:hypothetical protein
MRVAMAQSAPTASRTRLSVSTQNLALFSSDPPYLSLRWLWNGEKNCAKRYPYPASTSTMS